MPSDATEKMDLEALQGPFPGKSLKQLSKTQVLAGCLVVAVLLVLVLIVVSASRSKEPEHEPAPPVPSAGGYGALYTDEVAAANWRSNFAGGIQAAQIGSLVEEFSRLPHIAGGARNTELAMQTAQKLRDWGFDDVRTEQFPALLMTVPYRSLNATDAATGAILYEAALKEVDLVNQSGWADAMPPTNGYTGEGNVQNAPLVWVNYGRQEDFDAISHVNLTGCVVMVRYGKIFRGNKVRLAAQRGAVGVVIALDPADTAKGPGFPAGPWANNVTVQRGSITLGEGDPLTPSWPSQDGGPTVSNADLFNDDVMQGGALPQIPVQPIGFGDATRILSAAPLRGEPLPQNWSSTNYSSYFALGIGPGPLTVSLEVRRNLTRATLTNVFGTIRGGIEPDRTVAIGSHRDAWTYGAVDPISGHSTTLEIARNLGRLHQGGWTPRRTIQVCSWDAEEWALIGSVEYVETNVELLRQRGAVYLNLDVAVSGTSFLTADCSPSIGPVIHEVASGIAHPTRAGATLDDVMLPMNPPGSGSDHLAWIQLAGVPIVTASFTNGSATTDDAYSAVYHSNYDSYYWSSRFGDPGFTFHAAAANFYGRLLMRFADDNVLPFSASQYAQNVSQWVSAYRTTMAAKPPLQTVNWTFMNTAVARFAAAAERHRSRIDSAKSLLAQGGAAPLLSPFELRAINDVQMGLERVFLGWGSRETGAEWYKHVLYTPSSVNSYGSTVMPLIADSLATKDPAQVEFAVGRIAQFIYRAAQYVNSSFIFPPPN